MRVGIDIGGTKADAVVLDTAGEITHSLRLPTLRGDDAVIATASEAVRSLAAEAGLAAAADFESIGIGIPGAVDSTTGVVTHARNLGVDKLDLGPRLERELGVAVRVENDVNAAALGAFHLLDLPPESSMAYLNLGTGLAAGIVLGGRLLRGSRGAAGEIGHILVDPQGPLDTDGQAGALEVLASGSGIGLQWGHGGDGVRSLLEAAASGDPEALRIRRGLNWGVATAVRILVLTLDVEVVVIGGGISTLGDALLDEVRAVFDEWGATSPFIASLQLGERVRILPQGSLIAAVGAAWSGAAPWQK